MSAIGKPSEFAAGVGNIYFITIFKKDLFGYLRGEGAEGEGVFFSFFLFSF